MEATRALRNINCPSFHHEFVKRGVAMGCDRDQADRVALSSLLAHISAQGLMSQVQTEKGFRRVLQSLPDTALDAPHADQFVNDIINRAVADGILSEEWLNAAAGNSESELVSGETESEKAQVVSTESISSVGQE